MLPWYAGTVVTVEVDLVAFLGQITSSASLGDHQVFKLEAVEVFSF